MEEQEFLEINRKAWNAKTKAHVKSDFYDVPSFLAGKTALKHTDLALVDDVNGKDLVHLQCHFGLDTLSFARMGAKVWGLDLSDESIDEARRLTNQIGVEATFVQGNVHDAPELLSRQFDVIYTGWGALCWLPDLKRWGKVINELAKPGTELYICEFHPACYMLCETQEITDPYFNTKVYDEVWEGTYTDGGENVNQRSISWGHSLADIMMAVIENGFEIQEFREWDHLVYPCFSNLKEDKPGEWVFEKHGRKIPYGYGLKAVKK